MSVHAISPRRVVGCDVGKAEIVVFDSGEGRTRTLANQPDALAAFAASLDADTLVVCEATGGYEAALLDALVRAGRLVHRADARKVKAFIRSLGTLGKTDALDARALARYGQERHDRLACWHPRDPQKDRLQALVMLRLDLVKQRTAMRNRLAAPGTAALVSDRLNRILAAIQAEIDDIMADINRLIAEVPLFTRSAASLQSITGVGQITAAAFLALMPELGTLNRRQAAALAGLAPHPRQSGSADAYRRTTGGRPHVKTVLFMAALAAARHDPSLSAFYKRLRSAGKKPLVAITAVMRKIVVIANARLKQTSPSN
jgi:transposase